MDAAALLKDFPGVDVRPARWKESQDEFFVFILEWNLGAWAARDLNTLISDVLPRLFRSIEAPPALPSFAVTVEDESTYRAISADQPPSGEDRSEGYMSAYRCYLMSGEHIQAVQSLECLDDAEVILEATALLTSHGP
ncbi:MAG TPA: hypothetical protein VFE34_20535 [Dongiaceae bacterium]|jgi:hypothetical protein|nr:hypothetical protein [Dongiaceae bacterium]